MDSKTTWSKLAVKILMSSNPRLQGGRGFASEMRKLLSRLEEWNLEGVWEHHRPRFIPDAYLVDEKKEEVWVIEVEDTHPLTLEKLQRLINFYWWLDAYYWKLRVFTTNRYGQNLTEIPLFAYHYAVESPDRPDPRVEKLTDQQLSGLAFIKRKDVDEYIKQCLVTNASEAGKTRKRTVRSR